MPKSIKTLQREGPKRIFQHPKVICVDVDGTLIRNGQLNKDLVRWIIRMKKNYSVYLWSMRGEEYCQSICRKFRLGKLFNKVISKPGLVVDDSGWNWISETRVIRIHGT